MSAYSLLMRFIKNSNKKTIVLVFVTAILLIISKSGLLNKFSDEIKVVNSNSYNSISSDLDKSKPFETTIKEKNTIKKILIIFSVRIYKIDNYNNIFQLGPAPEGMRIEFGYPLPRGMYLIDGDYNPGICLNENIEFDKWYEISIEKDLVKGILRVKIDDKITEILTKQPISISELAVGAGYNKTRKFDGEIKDFSIKYEIDKPDIKLVYLKKIVNIIIIILCLTVVLMLLKKIYEKLVYRNGDFNQGYKEVLENKYNDNSDKIILNRFWRVMLIAVVVLFPIMLLLRLKVDIGYYDDWYDNMYFIGYFGEYFRNHFSFPQVLNCVESIGIMVPVFYGYLIYPLAGFVSFIAGANFAVRILFILLYLGQFIVVKKTIEIVTKNEILSFCTACLSIWAIYPLTSIYNRGSLPEVYSSAFLLIAVMLYLLLFIIKDSKKLILVGLLFTFNIASAFGTWPPTLIQGSLILLFVTVCFLPKIIRNFSDYRINLIVILSSILITTIILFPWLYVTLKYMKHLPITEMGLGFLGGIDDFWVRFSTFPLDLRSLYSGLNVPGGTPYLEAQVNTPLLLFFLFQLFLLLINIKSLAVSIKNVAAELIMVFVSILGFVYFSLMSLSRSFVDNVPEILKNIHFHYRFIPYQNITVLLAVIFMFALLKKLNVLNKYKQLTYIVLTVCLTIAGQSMIIKNLHGNSITDIYKYPTAEGSFGFLAGNIDLKRKSLLNCPGSAGHVFGYIDVKEFKQLPEGTVVSQRKFIDVLYGKKFGNYNKEDIVSMPEEGWISVNMYPFSWNKLYVDGVLVKNEEIYVYERIRTAFKLPAGEHKISINFEPDKLWLFIRQISLLIYFILIVLLIIVWIKPEIIIGKQKELEIK